MVRGEKIVKPCIIYGLYSSRDGELRYIGQTIHKLSDRLARHKSCAKNKRTAVNWWFLREMKDGFEIDIRLLKVGEFNTTEMELIEQYKSYGARLLNHTNGGNGNFGWHPSAETRANMSASQRGRRHSAESKLKISAALLGRKQPMEERQKRGSGQIGRKLSDETKARISAAHKGKKCSEETKAKLSIAGMRRIDSIATREKRRASLTGLKRSPESIERIRAAAIAYQAWRRSASI